MSLRGGRGWSSITIPLEDAAGGGRAPRDSRTIIDALSKLCNSKSRTSAEYGVSSVDSKNYYHGDAEARRIAAGRAVNAISPHFSPDSALRCRRCSPPSIPPRGRTWPGKEESAIRPAPRSGGYCMFLPSVGFGLRQLGLSVEDRIGGSDAF